MWSEKHCCILKEDVKILAFYLEQSQKLFDFYAMMPRTGFYQYKMCSFSAIYSKLVHYLLHCPCKRFAVITELNEQDVSETKVFQIHLLAKLLSLICFRGIMYVVDLPRSLHFQWRAWGQENWLFAECRYRVFFPVFFAEQFHTLAQTSFIRLSFVAIINNDWKHVCWQWTKHVAGVLASQTRHRMNDGILSKLRIVINLLRGINWKHLSLSFSNCFQEIRFSSRNLIVMFSMNLAPVLHLSSSQVELTRFCGIKWILIQLQQRMENELEVRMEIFLQTMETTREYKSFGGVLKYHNLIFFLSKHWFYPTLRHDFFD